MSCNCNCAGYHKMNLDWLIQEIKNALAEWDIVQHDWEETKQYITDYFANLDVQEEINNKLNEMAQDGTLAEIINEEIFNDLNTKIDGNTQEIDTLKTEIDGFDGRITNLEKKPFIGGVYNFQQIFIRSASDKLSNGNYPTKSATLQGMCCIDDGFCFAKQFEEDQNNTLLVYMNRDGTVTKKIYSALGHANSMAYDKDSDTIYVTSDIGGVYKLALLNNSTGQIKKYISEFPCTNIGIDREKRIIYGYDSGRIYELNIATEEITSHVINNDKDYSTGQGGCWAKGYYFHMLFNGIAIYDTNTWEYIGFSKYPARDDRDVNLREPEDMDFYNDVFYVNNGNYFNLTLPESKGVIINNPIHLCSFDPFKNSDSSLSGKSSGSSWETIYVKSTQESDWENGVLQDGTQQYPFIGFNVMSWKLSRVQQVNASNYTFVPKWGDCLTNAMQERYCITFGNITLNGPLYFVGVIVESANGRINLTKGANNSIVCARVSTIYPSLTPIGYSPDEIFCYIHGESKVAAYFGNYEEAPAIKAGTYTYVKSVNVKVVGDGGVWERCRYRFASSQTPTIPCPDFYAPTIGICGLLYFTSSTANKDFVATPTSDTIMQYDGGYIKYRQDQNNGGCIIESGMPYAVDFVTIV